MIFAGTLLLPVLSLYLGTRASLFYENITYVGNMKQHHLLFIIWGTLNSLYYMGSYLFLIKQLPNISKHHSILCICMTILSILSFLCPYKLHSGDLLSQFHVYGSIIAGAGTLALLMHTTLYAQMFYPHYFSKIKNMLMMILIISSTLLLTLGDISTLMELVLLNGLNYIFAYIFFTSNKITSK